MMQQNERKIKTRQCSLSAMMRLGEAKEEMVQWLKKTSPTQKFSL